MNKKLEQIPKGHYCYNKDGVCPHWENHPEYGEQNSGYCSLLEIGDWMFVPENQWIGKDGIIRHMGLLWDKVKICEKNEDK